MVISKEFLHILKTMHYCKSVPYVLMLSSTIRRHNVTIFDVTKQMLGISGLFLIIFEPEKKNRIFQFLTKGTPCLQNKFHKNL